jgi:hypothetical protein
MRARPWLAGIVLALSSLPAQADDDGYVPLIRGDDPRQFELVGIGPDTLKIADGEVRVSGKPNGYFATKDSYRNYSLKFEWMYERPADLAEDVKFRGNSGLLIHVQEPKVWPRSIEAQLMYADAGNLFAIQGAKVRGRKDPEAQRRATRPVGQWNQEEVVCKDGTITCTINGVEVARGAGADPDHGPIGWQSEGVPIRFRNLKIKPLD